MFNNEYTKTSFSLPGQTGKHIRHISELHPKVQALVGIARQNGEPEIIDVKGESIVEEYLKEKYK